MKPSVERLKELKKAYVKARCDERLKSDVDEIARLQGIDHADVVRIACQNHVQKVRESLRGITAIAS